MRKESDVASASLPRQQAVGPDEAAGASPSNLGNVTSPALDGDAPGTSIESPLSKAQEGRTVEVGKSRQHPMKRTTFRRLSWGVSDDLATLKREVAELRELQNLGPSKNLSEEMASLKCEVATLREAQSPGVAKNITGDLVALKREVTELRDVGSEMLRQVQGECVSENLVDVLAALKQDVIECRAGQSETTQALKEDLASLRFEFDQFCAEMHPKRVGSKSSTDAVPIQLPSLSEVMAKAQVTNEIISNASPAQTPCLDDLAALRKEVRGVSEKLAEDLAALKRDLIECRAAQSQGDHGLHALRRDFDKLHTGMQPGAAKMRGSTDSTNEVAPVQLPSLSEVMAKAQVTTTESTLFQVPSSSEVVEASDVSFVVDGASSPSEPRSASDSERRSSKLKRSRTTGPIRSNEEVAALRKEVGEMNDALSRIHASCEDRDQSFSTICSQLDAKVQQAWERLESMHETTESQIFSTPNRTVEAENAITPNRTSSIQEAVIAEGGLLEVQERLLKIRGRLFTSPSASKELGEHEDSSLEMLSAAAPEDSSGTAASDLRKTIQALEEGLMERAREAALEECRRYESCCSTELEELSRLLAKVQCRLEALEELRGRMRNDSAALDECSRVETELSIRILPLESLKEHLEAEVETHRQRVENVEQQLNRLQVSDNSRILPLESMKELVEKELQTHRSEVENLVEKELQTHRSELENLEQQLNSSKDDVCAHVLEVVDRFTDEKFGPVGEQLDIMRDELVEKMLETERIFEKIQQESEKQRDGAHAVLIANLPQRVAHLEAGAEVLPGRLEILERVSETMRSANDEAQSDLAMLQGNVDSLTETVNGMAQARREEAAKAQKASSKRRGSSLTSCFRH